MDTRSGSRKNRAEKSNSDDNNNDMVALDLLTEDSQALYMLITDRFNATLLEIEKRMDAKDARIDSLERQVAVLKSDLSVMNDRLDNAESSERKDMLIMSGVSVPQYTEGENARGLVLGTIKQKMKLEFKSDDFLEVFRLGKKPVAQQPDKRSILMRLRNSEIKENLLGAARKVKPEGLYFNENLTATRSNILYTLRQAKRFHPEKISTCGSTNGRVYVMLQPTTPTTRRAKLFIGNRDKLEAFLSDTVCENVASLLSRSRSA